MLRGLPCSSHGLRVANADWVGGLGNRQDPAESEQGGGEAQPGDPLSIEA